MNAPLITPTTFDRFYKLFVVIIVVIIIIIIVIPTLVSSTYYYDVIRHPAATRPIKRAVPLRIGTRVFIFNSAGLSPPAIVFAGPKRNNAENLYNVPPYP